VALTADYCGLSIDDLAARLRADHRATLLAVSRDGDAHVNPAADFRLRPGDDAVVVAESLGTLAPLRLQHD
jgi:voltage-gated potassium channel